MDAETKELLESLEKELESTKQDAEFYAKKSIRELRKAAVLKHMIKNIKDKEVSISGQ